MKQIFVRTEHCMGCHTCELHCAIEHSQAKDLFGAAMELPTPKKRLYVEPGKKGPSISESLPWRGQIWKAHKEVQILHLIYLLRL